VTTADVLLEAPKVGVDPDDEEGYYTVTTPKGEQKKHKRASDYVDLLDDKYTLRRHEDRVLARGVALRPDLVALAKSHLPDGDPADKDVYHTIILPQARMAAAADAKANIGNAFHRNTQEVDRGTPIQVLDPDWRRHLHVYANTIARIPFQVVERYIEQTVILDGHRIAGTIDRVLEATAPITITFPNGRKAHLGPGDLIIGDIKSGRWFTPLKWQIQCAVYANHTAAWDKDENHPHGGTRGPRINLRDDVALVIHIQAGNPEAPCELHWLDLATGYDAFLTALEIAGHRTAAKKATTLFTDWAPTSIEHQMTAWALERLAVVKTNPAATTTLQRVWPIRDPDTGQPIPYRDPTPEQTAALLPVLDRVEQEYQLPFTAQPGVTA